jgi:tryptophan synthase alpha chain
MNEKRLNKIFEQPKKILNVYFTAGYPTLGATIPIMQQLAQHGADIIELGMPYSDPLADGPVIQASSTIALQNGMSIEKLFEQLEGFRVNNLLQNTGVVLMGYMNPILQFGFERFCEKASSVGVDALILPDLPEYEFEETYGTIIKNYGLDFIFLITPETTEARVRKLDELSNGFLYAVSSSATTGSATNSEALTIYLKRLQSYQLKNPILVGFGIKDKSSFTMASHYSNGAIIGSAFIQALGAGKSIEEIVPNFLNPILQ